jgi:hypothetical protein
MIFWQAQLLLGKCFNFLERVLIFEKEPDFSQKPELLRIPGIFLERRVFHITGSIKARKFSKYKSFRKPEVFKKEQFFSKCEVFLL